MIPDIHLHRISFVSEPNIDCSWLFYVIGAPWGFISLSHERVDTDNLNNRDVGDGNIHKQTMDGASMELTPAVVAPGQTVNIRFILTWGFEGARTDAASEIIVGDFGAHVVDVVWKAHKV